MMTTRIRYHREATGFFTIFLPTAVALFTLFYNSITANGFLRFSEATFRISSLGIQNIVNLFQRTRRKFVIVSFISRGCSKRKKRFINSKEINLLLTFVPGKHDKVAIFSSWSARRVLRVVRTSKIMTDLVGQCDVTNGRRNLFPIIE